MFIRYASGGFALLKKVGERRRKERRREKGKRMRGNVRKERGGQSGEEEGRIQGEERTYFSGSFISPCLIPRSLCPHLSSALPTLPPTPSNTKFTRLRLLPLPVSPVYEGEFMGLPGAVSWRWPPPLKPQQGFALRVEQKRRGGQNCAMLPSARVYARCYTPTSHYLLTSVPVVFLLSLLIPATLPSRSGSLVGWFFFFSFSFFSSPPSPDFILLHLAFVFYWSTRSS